MNSARRFEILRTVMAILIALLISFGVIFFVSDDPLNAITWLLTGPLKSKRNFFNVV